MKIFDGGKIALSERPKLKEIKQLTYVDCNTVVTILAPKGDQALSIGNQVKDNKMNWEWVKVQNAVKMTELEKLLFIKAAQKILNSLLENKNILIHCSGGLHRTGMFAYCIFLMGGMTHTNAIETIKEIRLETYNALEEKYLTLANDLLSI